jgi:hypothetical protein
MDSRKREPRRAVVYFQGIRLCGGGGGMLREVGGKRGLKVPRAYRYGKGARGVNVPSANLPTSITVASHFPRNCHEIRIRQPALSCGSRAGITDMKMYEAKARSGPDSEQLNKLAGLS